MPYFTANCDYCGKKFTAYQRPNRPHQKRWYCCLKHYYICGYSRFNVTKEFKKERGIYDRERQKMKKTQIKQFGKKAIQESSQQ